ncbi:MAG: peptidylprolyl isomerase [Clostridiales bacterium]|jgi:peptidyl-prolyl cis-trans isomerase B (cyclophilin B)|nr:peptidylprolyl isomerase [Clostridiales bacterium]
MRQNFKDIVFVLAKIMVLGVLSLGFSACSSSSPTDIETESEISAEGESASPSGEITPEATVTAGPTPTPVILDLSDYEEVPLPQLDSPQSGEEIAVLTTDMGTIRIRFFPDYAPNAVQNFKTIAKSGKYDGVIFHRVIDEFVIQTGDTDHLDGRGGSSIWPDGFETEVSATLHHIRGAVGVARGESTSSQGSQFYIVQNKKLDDSSIAQIESYKEIQDHAVAQYEDGTYLPMAQIFPEKILDYYLENGGVPALDTGYTVFAQVIEGLDVVDKIAAVETTGSAPEDEATPLDKPLTDVVLQSVTFETYP